MAIEEFWGDGSGSAQALTTSYVAADEQRIANSCDFICRATIAGTAATRVEFQVQIRGVGGGAGDWCIVPLKTPSTSAKVWEDKPFAIDGAVVSDFPVFFMTPGNCDMRILARRVGGAVDTTLYLDGERRYTRDTPSMALSVR